jgi:hypothetical protein
MTFNLKYPKFRYGFVCNTLDISQMSIEIMRYFIDDNLKHEIMEHT